MSNHLAGQIAFISGASSGIGAACAERFAASGMHLILCARRKENVLELGQRLQHAYGINTYCFPLDVTQAAQVTESLAALPNSWQAIDVLVNNAGLAAGLDDVINASLADWEAMIDTNVKGLLYVTRQLLPGMVARNRGHIVNIGSIAGHEIYPKGAVYCATKHAVKALSKGLRMDLMGTRLRVTSIDPGMVATNFSNVRFKNDTERASAVYKDVTPLTAADIADAILYCITCPPHVNVSEMIIMPTQQAAASLVHRASDFWEE